MIDLHIHSYEEKIDFAPITNIIDLYIKRDDLIHPFISGNKWRKLKFNLIKAKEENKTHLVTFGGAYSNHLLATAAAGAKFGFKTTAFVRGEKVQNPLLTMCTLFGMELIFVDRENYQNKEFLFDERYKGFNDVMMLAEGGYGNEAELGCREIVQELTQEYDHIFCACGTGATAAGIINEVWQQNLNIQVHIVSSLKSGDFLKNEIGNLLENPNEPFHLHTDYHFGGYAKTTPELIDFIKSFSKTTGILLDPVYTSKTLFAIQDLAQKNTFKKGAKVLMIHTGGLFGILGMMEKFS
jgi:1-aminocyclopropane-1-carboxylate deaminase